MRFVDLLAVVMLLVGCREANDLEYRPEERTDEVSVAYLKSLYRTAPLRIDGDLRIAGRITANDRNGNLYYTVCIEDSTGGIALRVGADNLYRRYWIGAEVTVRCNGLWLGAYGGALQLGAAPAGAFEVDPIAESEAGLYVTVDTGRQTEVIPYAIAVAQCSPRYLYTQVRLEGVQFAEEDLLRGWCDTLPDPDTGEAVVAAASRRLIDRKGDTLAVYTSPYADYAALPLPAGSGAVEGVLSYFNGNYQLRIIDYRRIDMSGERFVANGAGHPKAYL